MFRLQLQCRVAMVRWAIGATYYWHLNNAGCAHLGQIV